MHAMRAELRRWIQRERGGGGAAAGLMQSQVGGAGHDGERVTAREAA